VLLRGVNKMSIFTDRAGDTFPEIQSAGANSVRIVWATATDDFVPTAADLDHIIARALANRLIPTIELHDATGYLPGLSALVDYWTRPDIAAVLKKYERHLLVNVGNEVGDYEVDLPAFVAAYRSAVARMRAARIRALLVIDAPDYGKNIDVLVAAAPTLLAADPDHNLLFSVHTYWGIADGADADFIHAKLQLAANAGVPLLVGEFSRYGAYAGEASICSDAGEVDYASILAECDRLKIGWYAWEWGPGNVGGGDPLCAVMDMSVDGTLPGLQPGWATEVVATSPYGIQATSVVPKSIVGLE
jgi:mannan endo-1,4-beta-mannosidase